MWNTKTCRLCGQICEIVLPIFNKQDIKASYDLKIKKCVPIAINEDDLKPKQICYPCSSKLDEYHCFIEICLTTDFKFEMFLLKSSSDISQNKWCSRQYLDTDNIIDEKFYSEKVKERNNEVVFNTIPTPKYKPREDISNITTRLENINSEVKNIQLDNRLPKTQETYCRNNQTNNIYDPKINSHHLQTFQRYDYNKPNINNCILENQPPHFSNHYAEIKPEAEYYDCMNPQYNGNISSFVNTFNENERIKVNDLPDCNYYDERRIVNKNIYLQQNQSCEKIISQNNKVNTDHQYKYDKTQLQVNCNNYLQTESIVMDNFSQKTSDNNQIPKNDRCPTVISVEFIKQGQTPKTTLEDEQKKKPKQNLKKVKKFSCIACPKSFMRRSTLNSHMSVHTNIKPFQCNDCGKSYSSSRNLRVHQVIHAGQFTCEICNKTFSAKRKLERHSVIHTGARPYQCTICTKSFSDKYNLASHTATHTDHRPYQCTQCGRAFRVRSHYNDHQRVHNTDMPYICDTCGKTFKWKPNLVLHLRAHRGEKFECNVCNKQFSRHAKLSKHKRLHHSSTEVK